MDRKTEILSDRKTLDAILEKYGKDDVMQFLDVNFDDDNGTYFDTFNKEDNKEREKYYKKDNSVKFLRDNWEPRWNDLISLDSAESVYRYDPDTDSYNTTDITDGLDNDWLETWDGYDRPRYKSALPVMLFIPKENFKNAKLYWENLCRVEDKEIDSYPRNQFTINDPCDAFINLWYTKSWGWEAVMSIILYNFSTPYLYNLHFNLHAGDNVEQYKSMNIYRIVDLIYRMLKNGTRFSDNNI